MAWQIDHGKDRLALFCRINIRIYMKLKKKNAELNKKIAALEAELMALKRAKSTSGGKFIHGGKSAKSKDAWVKRIKRQYPKLSDNTEYQRLVDKYSGFYQICVNCGKTDLKSFPCGCGKKGEESSDPNVRVMYADFKKFKDFRKAAKRIQVRHR